MSQVMDSLIMQSMEKNVPMMELSFTIPFWFGLIFCLWWWRRPTRLPYPPGPVGLPVIGNMLMMDQLNHIGLAKLAKQYGGIFHLRMGSLHVATVSTPDVARQVLQVQDSIFSNRPATIAIRYLTYDQADMAFANYGPFWRQMRKLCVMKLFGRKRAQSSWESSRDEVNATVRTLASREGSAVNIREVMFTLMKNVVYRAAFGTSSQEGQEELSGILKEFGKLFGEFNIADFIPWLGWVDFDSQGLNGRLVKARESLDRFINKVIDDHMQKKIGKKCNEDGEGKTDIVDELLAFYCSEEAGAGESDHHGYAENAIKVTRENIKGIIMDIMFGGIDTVASVTEWAMAELMRNPEELKRVQQELADVVGLNRRLEESDFEKLTYLKCVLKETLRLHPPVPLLRHETEEDAAISGYHIPKKSHVMINVWAIGRDKDAWHDPDTFKPSRFLNHDAHDIGNFEFIPFGSGRRSCPGMQLGKYVLELVVGHLLHCFTWELADGMKPCELDMNDALGLTSPPASALVAVPTKRLVCSLS